jgi:hypothetical protein
MIDYKPLRYENYDYPDWADGIGWFLAALSTMQIPIWAFVIVFRTKGGSIKEVKLNLTKFIN